MRPSAPAQSSTPLIGHTPRSIADDVTQLRAAHAGPCRPPCGAVTRGRGQARHAPRSGGCSADFGPAVPGRCSGLVRARHCGAIVGKIDPPVRAVLKRAAGRPPPRSREWLAPSCIAPVGVVVQLRWRLGGVHAARHANARRRDGSRLCGNDDRSANRRGARPSGETDAGQEGQTCSARRSRPAVVAADSLGLARLVVPRPLDRRRRRRLLTTGACG
jgi:hypothetical protein